MKAVTLIIILFVSIAVTFANDDVVWIKSGGRYGSTASNYKIAGNNKYFIFEENNATNYIDIKTGNLVKTYTNSISDDDYFDNRIFEDFIDDSILVQVYRDTINYLNFYTNEIKKQIIHNGDYIGFGEFGFADYYEEKSFYSEKYNALITTSNSKSIGIWYFDTGVIEEYEGRSKIMGLNYLEKTSEIIFSDDVKIYVYDIEQKKITRECMVTEGCPNKAAYNIVLSPDESLFAFQTYDYYNGSYLYIYNSKTLERINVFECRWFSCQASISFDNKDIAFPDKNGNIKILDIETGEIKFDYDPIDILSQVFFYNNDKSLIAVNQYTGVTLMFDIETEEQVKTLVVNDDETDILKLSDNGEYLVAYGYGYGRMKIINSETGNLEQLWVLSGAFGDNEFFQVDFHDDLILCCNQSKRIYLIDRFEGILGRYDMDEEIWDVAFAPDGNTFLSGSVDGKIRIHNTLNGIVINELNEQDGLTISHLSHSDDPSIVYVISLDQNADSYGKYHHCKFSTNQLIFQYQGFEKIYYRWSRDIINNRYFKTLGKIFDLKQQKYILDMDLEYSVVNLDISKNNKYVAFGNPSHQFFEREYFDLFNFETNKLAYRYYIPDYWTRVIEKNFRGRFGIPSSVAISPDNKYIYTGLNNGTIMKLKLKDTLGTDIAEEYNREGGLLAYPNPLTDRIIIENRADNKIITGLCLADIFGNEIVSKSANELYSSDNKIEINSLNLPAGTYFLIVRYSDGGQAVKKLIKY